MKPNLLMLICRDDAQANKIVDVLLVKHLVICAKKVRVATSSLWKGKREDTKEILLIMDSVEENFEKVEKEVRLLHSYKTFVLFSVPIRKTNQSVLDWMKEEIR